MDSFGHILMTCSFDLMSTLIVKKVHKLGLQAHTFSHICETQIHKLCKYTRNLIFVQSDIIQIKYMYIPEAVHLYRVAKIPLYLLCTPETVLFYRGLIQLLCISATQGGGLELPLLRRVTAPDLVARLVLCMHLIPVHAVIKRRAEIQ